MANGKLTKAEKRRRAQQSNRDRSSRGQQTNMGTNPLSTTQTHTIMTMASTSPQSGTALQVCSFSIAPAEIPALRLALAGCVSWRIRSCQAYLIPTVATTNPLILGLLVTPELWAVSSLAELQACGGTITKSTVAKVSSNTIGAETIWKPKAEASTYQVYIGSSKTGDPRIELGMLEYRIVIETRGISVPAVAP
jgi:hypothetical protein